MKQDKKSTSSLLVKIAAAVSLVRGGLGILDSATFKHLAHWLLE